MLSNLQKRKSEGFTIIEVMIVLAIAGLIMLIVFLAVPALQRNSRNTQYKNDAGSILSAASEWSNNNSGSTPTAGISSTSTTAAAAIMGLTKTKSITVLNITAYSAAARTPTFSQAELVTGAKCPATVSGSSVTPQQSATRALMLVYAVENSSGGVVAQCTES